MRRYFSRERGCHVCSAGAFLPKIWAIGDLFRRGLHRDLDRGAWINLPLERNAQSGHGGELLAPRSRCAAHQCGLRFGQRLPQYWSRARNHGADAHTFDLWRHRSRDDLMGVWAWL